MASIDILLGQFVAQSQTITLHFQHVFGVHLKTHPYEKESISEIADNR